MTRRKGLSRRQKALLHVAKSKLRIDDASYRSILAQLAGVTSSTELDVAGFEAIMGYFEWLGFVPRTPKGRDFGTRPGMASFAQIELIRALWDEYTRGACQGEDALNAWLERWWKVSSLRFLTSEAAPKVITALKAMKARAA